MSIFPRSSMVERIPVKNKVVGSNPTEGAERSKDYSASSLLVKVLTD